MCCRTGKYTVCRRIPAISGPEILQAWAVKGLRHTISITHQCLNLLKKKKTEDWLSMYT